MFAQTFKVPCRLNDQLVIVRDGCGFTAMPSRVKYSTFYVRFGIGVITSYALNTPLQVESMTKPHDDYSIGEIQNIVTRHFETFARRVQSWDTI